MGLPGQVNIFMIDVVFCSIPYSNPDHIYPAPAILKGVAIQNGYTAKTVDFGGVLLELCDWNLEEFENQQNYFINPTLDQSYELLDEFFKQAINFFIQNPSKYIGISVLSAHSHKCAIKLCQAIRQANIQSKIVIGGMGADISTYSVLFKEFNISGVDKLVKFGELLHQRQLADHVVYGDGEEAIVKVLAGESVQQTEKNISEEFRYPVANYDDYDFRHYVFPDDEMYMPITGSKGCVRDCDFCDVRENFGRYRYRSGLDVANEMISLSKKHRVRRFRFTDNLVNGGYKPFMQFLNVLSDYNTQNPSESITWTGQYICRDKKEFPKGLHKLIAESGGEGLTIGAESGSDHVLKAMNKKSTVGALFDELELFRQHNITCQLLTFVGHWSEEHEHFLEHCEMFLNLMPYIRSGNISAVELGDTFLKLNGTPSDKFLDGSHFSPELVWQTDRNPKNTIKERAYRRMIVLELSKRWQIPMLYNNMHLTYLANILELYTDQINEFYTPTQEPCQAEIAYKNFDTFYCELVNRRSGKIDLEIELLVSECNGAPAFQIEINDQEIYHSELPAGLHVLKFSHNLGSAPVANLKWSMTNKQPGQDTRVDEHGHILEDKFIIINRLKINNYEIERDPELFRSVFDYGDSNVQYSEPKMGFWSNASLSVSIDMPVVSWYNKHSTKNIKLAENLKLQDADTASQQQRILRALDRLYI